MSPRVLVCPQEFKGSLTAVEAAGALAEGVRAALGGEVAIRELPLGDGGPGTVDACIEATGAERVVAEVVGPLGGLQRADYALLNGPDGMSAVIESAAACGLVLVKPDDRRPALASTFGVGQLVADALARGARRIVLGVGGSGTNDGGAGAAQALGLRLLDLADCAIPPGVLGLARLASIQRGDVAPGLEELELRVAVDVTNPLLGSEGATAIYGPQKGVQDWQLPAFDAALAGWAVAIERDLGLSLADLPGAGAGGGLPVGLLAAVRAAGGRAGIESGAALVADLVDLRGAIAEADLVVTGEGSVDAQTAYGKTVGYVASLAAELGRPCLAIGGLVEGRPEGVLDTEASAPDGVSVEEAMALGAEPVRAAAERVTRRWAEANER
jgi:glycerate kinase